MMTVKITPIPAYNDNYIWLIHDETHAVAVDPGLAEPVNEFLTLNQLKLTHILITHHHWDHVNGVEALQAQWSCEVFSPVDERIPGHLTHVKDNDQIDLPTLNLDFKVMTTPGHTSTHICYFNSQWLFCGDTLFSMGCGRMFEGTPEQYTESLEKIKQLPPQTQVYCTHEYTLSNIQFALSIEPENKAILELQSSVINKRHSDQPSLPTTLATETSLNPFLRTADSCMQELLSQKAKALIADKVTCFAMLRQMKDRF